MAVVIRGRVPLLVGFAGLEGRLGTAGPGTSDRLAPEEAGASHPAWRRRQGDLLRAADKRPADQAVQRARESDARTVRSLVRFGGTSPIRPPDRRSPGGVLVARRRRGGELRLQRPRRQREHQRPGSLSATRWSRTSATRSRGKQRLLHMAFLPPILNDAVDQMLESITRGTRTRGIFPATARARRWRPSCACATPPSLDGSFSNLVGDPSMNANGDVAFGGKKCLEPHVFRARRAAARPRAVALTLDDLNNTGTIPQNIRTVSPIRRSATRAR